jgi:carbamoyltransferase
MAKAILGISAYYHDSAAVLLVDGDIIAAAQEERFTRKKHDSDFPAHAVKYVLREGGMDLSDLECVAFYDKPYLKFERLLETYHGFAPKGLRSFLAAIPVWIKEKLFMRRMLQDELGKLGTGKTNILFPEHHLSHAASAFYPSPFQEAAILTIDGVGEWATTTICEGNGRDLAVLRELAFPHSLGLLYSAFTYYCGFRVNSGEYKLMGLAPYGNPEAEETQRFYRSICEELVDIREDGSFLLNMDFFQFATGLTMTNDRHWEALFGLPRREPESDLSQNYMNLALAIQQVTECIILKLARTAKTLTGCKNLALAGGVALNCVANGHLLRNGIFENIWVQPAAGDAGGALGAALVGWYIHCQAERKETLGKDSMKGAFLGPIFSESEIVGSIRKYDACYTKYETFDDLCSDVADLIDQGNVIGWFQGRMEYGPRALGNRSILGDPRNPEMQKKLNLKIKYRESFRPFAPSVLEEDIEQYFELDATSPYMLLVAPVKPERQINMPESFAEMDMRERLYFSRSDLPAITHIDYSARIQSVSREVNPKYWELINVFRELTGCGVLVNTSFNVRGEPIVCTPKDAYICFMRTEMDYLVMGNLLFNKSLQPEWLEKSDWRESFVLD